MLLNINGQSQPSTGKGEHWNQFIRFQNSRLHRQLLEELILELENRDHINSRELGSTILRRIQNWHKQFDQQFPGMHKNNIFGMTLWNYLAESSDETWYFTSLGADNFGWTAKNYWK